MSEYTISCWSCRGSGIHYATGEDCHICLHPSGLFSTGRVTVVPVSEKTRWQAEALREAARDVHPFYPQGGHATVTRGGLHQWLNDRAARIEKGEQG